MCGRGGLRSAPKDLTTRYNIDQLPLFTEFCHPDQYMPGGRVIAVVHGAFKEMVWGFSIGNNAPYPVYNARSETIRNLNMWLPMWRQMHRCILPVTVFQEKDQQGHWASFLVKDLLKEEPDTISLAGLYDTKMVSVGSQIIPITYMSVITCNANAIVAPVHHRMPCILPLDQTIERLWLDPTTPFDNAYNLLRQYDDFCHPLSRVM